ncbi:holothin acyltransferase-like isoform X1 [Branchiostoma lanceolatum]|uniref:holothin acyltransferase-like isoform X1 n=2 Tax=Branchiostoma lanceolatum TaxID=7740 RepID=UPI0034526572
MYSVLKNSPRCLAALRVNGQKRWQSPGTSPSSSVRAKEGGARGKDDQPSKGSDKTEHYHVRLMTSPSELSLLLEWAVAEGWNPGVYDAESYFRQDPTGFYLAELDGVPIGGLGSVKCGEDLGSMCLYVIKPPFRGKGYGYRMWKEVIKKTGNRNMFLESVAAQQSNYEKSGFVPGLWQTTRFRGVGRDDVHNVDYAGNHVTLVSVDEVDLEDLCAFDQRVFGAPRPAFLKSWINQPGMVGLVAIESLINIDDHHQNRESTIVGYGCIRLCYEGYQSATFSRKIGPIFAESSTVGSQLFKGLVATVPLGIPFYIDVINTNKGAMRMVEEFGVESMFQTTRMFTKGNWGVQTSLTYGQTTLEMG